MSALSGEVGGGSRKRRRPGAFVSIGPGGLRPVGKRRATSLYFSYNPDYPKSTPVGSAFPPEIEGARTSMSTTLRPSPQTEIVYPESDGELMAENTVQFQWIVTIEGGLENVFRDDPNVFVAGDLFWYPVEGNPTVRMAPGVLVAFGRPK